MEVPRESSKPEQRRRKFTWPKEAFKLIRQKRHPTALCEELASLTGNDKNACWRFLNRNGIQRPGSKSRRSFPPDRVHKIIEYIGEHGVGAASERFGCKPKALYNLLDRHGHTRLGKDCLSLRQFCANFRVKHRQAFEWMDRGLLAVTREQSRTGRVRYSIEFKDLRKFCEEHRNLLLTNRICEARLEFLQEFVFAPKHADLLPTRESKREGEAFERGEYIDPEDRNQSND
jgi:hypothetical protein